MKHFARKLRKHQTDSERHLWFYLRGRRLGGHKFRRQYQVGPYILDFVCLKRKLAVELDGGQHNEKSEYDDQRTNYIAERGYMIMRFWNHEVFQETKDVLEMILEALDDSPSPQPSPPAGARAQVIL